VKQGTKQQIIFSLFLLMKKKPFQCLHVTIWQGQHNSFFLFHNHVTLGVHQHDNLAFNCTKLNLIRHQSLKVTREVVFLQPWHDTNRTEKQIMKLGEFYISLKCRPQRIPVSPPALRAPSFAKISTVIANISGWICDLSNNIDIADGSHNLEAARTSLSFSETKYIVY